MTLIRLDDTHTGQPQGVNVWRCEGCGCFHLRAGAALLTFTPREFEDFTQRVADCYVEQAAHDLSGGAA